MGIWSTEVAKDVIGLRTTIDDLCNERERLFSSGLRSLPLKRLRRDGVDDEIIATIAQCPVEDVQAMYEFDRKGRAKVLEKMRKIVQVHGTFDYLDREFTLEKEE